MARLDYSLLAEDEPHQLEPDTQQPDGVTRPAHQRLYRLKWYHIYCIIVQRMIGTGIFSTSTNVLSLTQNISVALLFWGIGAIVTLAVTVIYLEYASAIPQVPYGHARGQRHLPMNGGELIYLTHAFRDSRFFISCVFGTIFVVLGNSAANCISFASHFLRFCGYQVVPTGKHQWAVTGVAIAASTLVCFLHATWRKWGMRLNNGFAVVKLLMLVFIILLGFSYPGLSSTRGTNLKQDKPFQAMEGSPWKNYAIALLDVVFSYGGWNQGNYVFGEVGMSPRAFRWTVLSAVLSVSVLYILVNVAYVWVIQWPYVDSPDYVVLQFFKDTIGSYNPGIRTDLLVNFMLAFSSFGNIIVTTFTSARVKQEVAKEGVFLYEKSIHIVRSWSIRDRLFENMARGRNVKVPTTRDARYVSHGATAKAPTPALILHCVFSIALILIATVASPSAAYGTILGIYAYLVDISIPLLLAVSLLYLRRTHRLPRTQMPVWVSLICAVLVIPAYLYIFVMLWVPQDSNPQVRWYVVPVVAVSVMALGSLYWAVLFVYRQFPRANEVFHIARTPTVFAKDNRLILVKDKIRLQWQAPGSAGPDMLDQGSLAGRTESRLSVS